MNIQETDLEQRSYIYTINVISFVKSMKKAGIENENLTKLMKFASDFGKIILDIIDIEDNNIIKTKLEKSLGLAKNCHELFMNIRCNENKELINEKADLQIETTYFVNTILKLL